MNYPFRKETLLRIKPLLRRTTLIVCAITFFSILFCIVLNLFTSSLITEHTHSSIFGYKLYLATDNSMKPQIRKHDAVFVRPSAADRLTTQDTILVRVDQSLKLLHIESIVQDKINYTLTALTTADPDTKYTISEQDIVGKVSYKSALLGVLLTFAGAVNTVGLFVITPIVVLLLLLVAGVVCSVLIRSRTILFKE